MVYYNRIGTSALIKTAWVCALTIPFGHAQDASSSTSSDVCEISDGDKGVGIRGVNDATCASGGLGCYNEHCRFCKVLETPQSSSFENCSSFGVEFPTMAPLIVSSGSCGVSSGDAAVGISAFTDDTCLYGGLGCFNDHCRFCKETNTAQSEAFINCPNDSMAGSASIASDDSSSSASSSADTVGCTLEPPAGDIEVGISIGTDPTCSTGGLGCINDVCRFCRIRTTTKSAIYPDCSFIGTNAANLPSTPSEAPVVTTEAPLVVKDTSTTNSAAPVATSRTSSDSSDTPVVAAVTPSFTDAPAAHTKAPSDSTDAPTTTTDSPNSTDEPATDASNYTDAPVASTEAPSSATDAPVAFTGAPSDATDAPAATSNASNNTDAPVASTEVPSGSTDAPVAPTEVPSGSTDAPDVTTETPSEFPATTEGPLNQTPPSSTKAPADSTNAPAAPSDTSAPISSLAVATTETCTITASVGDAAVGINIVSDPTCVSGGVGCLTEVCRFCKVTTSPQSAAFVDCALFATADSPSDAPVANSPNSDEGNSSTDDSNSTDDDFSTDDSSSAANDPVVNEAPSATGHASTTTTETPTNTSARQLCTQTGSAGDVSVGINIVTDGSCSAGGVGCIDNICRFCKVFDTPQSAAFVDCASTTSTSSAAADAINNDISSNDSTEAPANDDTEAPVDGATESPTDDASEAPTDASTHALNDFSIDGSDDVPSDSSSEAPTGERCTQSVSEGDASVGINIVTDASCNTGGAGCIDNICRFCKVVETPQSTAFVDCASVPATFSNPNDVSETPTEAPSDGLTEAPTDETCTRTVSDGDAAVGIDIVTDATCSSGGAGCIDNICRFCKVSETPQSAAFVDCVSIASVEALTGNTRAETLTQSIAHEAVTTTLRKGQIGAAIAGCVGAIVAVAIVALAVKRSLSKNAKGDEASQEDEDEDIETGDRVSPGTVPAEDPAIAEAQEI